MSSKEGVSTCNPQSAWIHGLQADVVALIKKLDCTCKLAAKVCKSFSKCCLHPTDINAVYGESDAVMKKLSNGIVLKKRLGVDVIIPTPCYYQSTIFMCEVSQSSVWLKLGNFCENQNILRVISMGRLFKRSLS